MYPLPYKINSLSGGSQSSQVLDDNFLALRNVAPALKTTTYTTVVGDHLLPIYVTGNTQINLGDVSLMVSGTGGYGYQVTIINIGTGTVTIGLTTAANKLCGAANGNMTIPPRRAVTFCANVTNDGYDALHTSNGILFDSSDPSKQARFELSGVTSGQTRVITVPDGDVTISNVPSGVIIDYAGSSVPSGWLECDGSAVSRSTYAALFAAISTAWGAGDGVTTFNLPDFRGRARVGKGTGTLTESVAAASVSTAADTFTVASNNAKWITGQPVTLTTTGGLPAPLATATTYYVIRASATTIKLASSIANAKAGTAIDLTTQGTGTHTLTGTLTARTLAEIGGEETHLLVASELPIATGGDAAAAGSGATPVVNATPTPMNNMQPFAVTMAIIKI